MKYTAIPIEKINLAANFFASGQPAFREIVTEVGSNIKYEFVITIDSIRKVYENDIDYEFTGSAWTHSTNSSDPRGNIKGTISYKKKEMMVEILEK